MIFIGIMIFFTWFFLPMVIVAWLCNKIMSLEWNVDYLVFVLISAQLINIAFMVQVSYWLGIVK